MNQFIPFVVTVVAILFTDLLIGICIGILTGLYFMIKSNFHSAIFFIKDEHRYLIRFRKEVSFLNKSLIKRIIEQVPDNTSVLIDATSSVFIDRDIIELVDDFIVNADTRNIRVYIKHGSSKKFFNDVTQRIIK